MRTLKKLMLLAMLALAPTAMFAADHIVFIHGWQWQMPLTRGGEESIDTWDRMTNFMANASFGTPFASRDKMLVVNYYREKGHGEGRSIEEVARDVSDQIKAGFPDGSCPSKMNFVVHSMGGLVLRTMIKNGNLPEDCIGRVVTLATPHYGTRWSGSTQRNQMQFGSEFIWELANSDNKINPSKVLCVVGTEDGTVDEWSAALNGCNNVRYVNRDHSVMWPLKYDVNSTRSDPGICFCRDGRNDVVYRLITEFLANGTASSAGSSIGSQNKGAILFQVVDGRGKPVAYKSNGIVWAVRDSIDYKSGPITSYLAKHPGNSVNQGIGSIHGVGGAEGVVPGCYVLDIVESKDKIFSAFTTEPIEVKRGRTTVIPIPAENVRPLDYVFLIDTTGSMGSHINSVKSNAKNLIQTKLLNGARDCRVAVVDYRDFKEHTGSSNDYEYKVRCEFTTDAATAISAINSLSAKGGGDTPETVYSGIHACIEGNGVKIGGWRPNAIKTIMVLGDAPPHDPEPVTGYTAADVTRWANTLKVDGDDTESGIIGLGSGISIYPVLTSSSSSLRDAFSGIAEETGGKVVSSSDYSSVADAVEEVIVQSVSANGFETEIVTARETDGKVTVRIFGGNETEPASIGYQIVSGSAESGKDFTGTDGIQRLTWLAGERSYKEIVVPVAEDSTTSNDKFFSIVLCDPSGMGLGGINVCRVNLLDKDSSGEYSVRDTYVQGVSRNTEMGSVSGSGFCALGSTKTLTATPESGFVFTSWENGSMASRRSITSSDASASAVDGVATYVASFISLADLPLPVIESPSVVTGIVGQAVSWGLDCYSMSEATLTCTGLPAGLTFSDGIISGTPNKSGASTLTFTARNAKGETSVSMTLVFVRDPYAPYLAEEGNEGEFDAKSGALTYDGYLLDASGNLAGTILVKAAKANARSGVSKITATVQPMNGKKLTFKGETDDGRSVAVIAGNQTAVLTLGVDGMTGKFGDYTIDGSRNVFVSKNNDEKSAANAVLGKWKAINVVWNGGSLSVAIAAKGKAKVTGILSDGTKVSAKGQLVIGTEWLCVPIVWAKQNTHLAFMLWMGKDGNDIMVDGLDNATVGQPAALREGATLRMDASALCSLLSDSTYGAYLPNGVAVEQKGTKWVVAGGAKAGKVQLGKDGNVDATKAGANASGLKLTYKAKDGTFKGSFKAYDSVKGKPNATTVNVTGVMIGDKGYGVATIKKKGSVIVSIE